MPVPAKVVNLIVPFEHGEWAKAGLKSLGVTHYTSRSAHGEGLHGSRTGGLTGTQNLYITIVTTAEMEDRILRWFEQDGKAVEAGIAWSGDVRAVFPEHSGK